MIFLGAGASAPLGIPTMDGFVRLFEENVIVNLENQSRALSEGAVGDQVEELEKMETSMWFYKEIKQSIKHGEEIVDSL